MNLVKVLQQRSRRAVVPSNVRRSAMLLSIAALPLWGQRATSLHLNPKLLPLRVDTFAVYIIRGSDTTQTGTLIDELRSQGSRLIRIYSQTDRVLGAQLDTIISNAADLSPSFYSTRSPEGIVHVTYTSRTVAGWRRLANGDSASVKAALPAVIYDGASYDLIVRASPLSDHFTLSVPAYLEGSGSVASIDGRITGSESVDGHACWVFLGTFSGMPVTFWIDKATRALRRQLMQPRFDLAILFGAPRTLKRLG